MNPCAVLHVPHSATLVPPEERGRILLSDTTLAQELLRMTDWYTDELFAVPSPPCRRVVFPVSRLVVDPERFERDEDEAMAGRGMGMVYTRTSQGDPLREAPTPEQRQAAFEKYYRPHHARLEAAVSTVLEDRGHVLVLDCHSFPAIPLPYEFDQDPQRPDICLGTDEVHTPRWLRDLAVGIFRRAGFTVEVDRPFSGTMVPGSRYRKDSRVLSIMVELNRSLYMDERSGAKAPRFLPFSGTLQSLLDDLCRGFAAAAPVDRSASAGPGRG